MKTSCRVSARALAAIMQGVTEADLLDVWIDGARHGRPRDIARLISRVENEPAAAERVIRVLHPHTGRAHRVGVTGPPGCGKSTLVNELAKVFRGRGLSVAIIAVDPSSPFTGGAILGDRVRMRDLSGDTGVFIRSMASRGSLGGLARGVAAAAKVLDAAGYDLILIETVGAGQAEVDIARTAQTVIVLEAPGMGDDVQSIKAGILEIADILVVNKADHPGAGRTSRSLAAMLELGHRTRPAESAGIPDTWAVLLLETVATTGQGVQELGDAVASHRQYLETTGEWQARERARSQSEIEQALRDRLMARLEATISADERAALVAAVAERRMDPYAAAARLWAHANPADDGSHDDAAAA